MKNRTKEENKALADGLNILGRLFQKPKFDEAMRSAVDALLREGFQIGFNLDRQEFIYW